MQHQRLRGTGGERRGAAGGAAADGGRGDGGVQDVLLGLAGGGTGVRRDGCGRNRLGGKNRKHADGRVRLHAGIYLYALQKNVGVAVGICLHVIGGPGLLGAGRVQRDGPVRCVQRDGLCQTVLVRYQLDLQHADAVHCLRNDHTALHGQSFAGAFKLYEKSTLFHNAFSFIARQAGPAESPEGRGDKMPGQPGRTPGPAPHFKAGQVPPALISLYGEARCKVHARGERKRRGLGSRRL